MDVYPGLCRLHSHALANGLNRGLERVFLQAYKACRPGGWVETLEGFCFIESDHCDLPADSALSQWSQFFVEGGKKLRRTFLVLEEEVQRKGMEAAGFVDIQEIDFKVRSEQRLFA